MRGRSGTFTPTRSHFVSDSAAVEPPSACGLVRPPDACSTRASIFGTLLPTRGPEGGGPTCARGKGLEYCSFTTNCARRFCVTRHTRAEFVWSPAKDTRDEPEHLFR